MTENPHARRLTAEIAQKGQASQAIAQLQQFGTSLPWPWKAMTDTLGPIQRGTIHYLCAPSGNGKSTMAGSLILGWLQMGAHVVSGWFERDAGSARRFLAAMSLGLNPGNVLGGEWEKDDDFRSQLDAMNERVREMEQGLPPWDQLHLIGHPYVSPKAIREMGQLAADLDGPGKMVVCSLDHIDHLGPDAAEGYKASSNAVYAVHAEATKYQTRWVCFSQMNNKALATTGTVLPRHRPMPPSAVSNGQNKEQVCWTMSGLYRPLRDGVTADDVKAVSAGTKPLADVLWQGVTALNVMKHRDHGERVGAKMMLGWAHGQIIDTPDDVRRQIEAKQHAIKTAPTNY